MTIAGIATLGWRLACRFLMSIARGDGLYSDSFGKAVCSDQSTTGWHLRYAEDVAKGGYVLYAKLAPQVCSTRISKTALSHGKHPAQCVMRGNGDAPVLAAA